MSKKKDRCGHPTVERIEGDNTELIGWHCAFCNLKFVPQDATAEYVDKRILGEVLDGVAGTMSAVLWDQTERMTEWLLGRGATKEEAAPPEHVKQSPFLDRDQP